VFSSKRATKHTQLATHLAVWRLFGCCIAWTISVAALLQCTLKFKPVSSSSNVAEPAVFLLPLLLLLPACRWCSAVWLGCWRLQQRRHHQWRILPGRNLCKKVCEQTLSLSLPPVNCSCCAKAYNTQSLAHQFAFESLQMCVAGQLILNSGA
jgi:hypothetical protein